MPKSARELQQLRRGVLRKELTDLAEGLGVLDERLPARLTPQLRALFGIGDAVTDADELRKRVAGVLERHIAKLIGPSGATDEQSRIAKTRQFRFLARVN